MKVTILLREIISRRKSTEVEGWNVGSALFYGVVRERGGEEVKMNLLGKGRCLTKVATQKLRGGKRHFRRVNLA